jgi:hypothetical protein
LVVRLPAAPGRTARDEGEKRTVEARKVVVNHEVKAGAAELFTVGQLAEIVQNPDPDFYDLAGDRAALSPGRAMNGTVSAAGETSGRRVAVGAIDAGGTLSSLLGRLFSRTCRGRLIDRVPSKPL